MTRSLAAAALALALGACTMEPPPHPLAAGNFDLAALVHRDALPLHFMVCRGYGCRLHEPVGLSPAEWRAILALFEPPAPDAAAERRRVAAAVARVERAVGARLGTDRDRPGTPFVVMDATQLDCVDEAINSSTALHLLAGAGLLRWHVPDEPVRRGGLLTIHFTAVLRESAGGARFAVDSWFHANGVPAEIVPLAEWRSGWRPAAVIKEPVRG